MIIRAALTLEVGFLVSRSPGRLSGRSVFIAVNGMQTRSSDENSVCASDCLSVKHVNYDKTKKNQSIFLDHTKNNLA